MKYFTVLFLFLISLPFTSNAQLADSVLANSDSSKVKSILKKHAPHTAAIMSAVLPGLGQAYNKKYWKIPIVYAGLGGLGYGIYYNGTQYGKARTSYLSYALDTIKANDIPFNGYTNVAQIQSLKEQFKNTRDLFSVIISVWYVLNIVDAAVDAHLFKYDVSDDLSLEINPHIYATNNEYIPGLQMRIKF
jgi:Family of unknown function (DUF5683)